MRIILEKLLVTLAKLYIWKYHPRIIAVTGNVGKTSTKEAVVAVLRSRMRVRAAAGNLNNELGVPLAILGDWSQEYYDKGGGWFFWLKVVMGGLVGLVLPLRFPRVLVLEYGADRPGDIKRLADLFKPHVGVVTAVGAVPVHVEFFKDPEHLANEKSKLVRALEEGDWAVLNYDEPTVLAMGEKTKAKLVTFGSGEGAAVRVSDYNYLLDTAGRAVGITVKLHDGRSFVPVKLYGSLGTAQAMAIAAAAAVGSIFDMNMVEISSALADYTGPAGRLRILSGIRDSLILDDTYNASPSSMRVALETLAGMPAKRKIAVLGDMLELGEYSFQAHRTVGDEVGNAASILVCVGDKAKIIADSAANQISPENIFTFETSDRAKVKVQELIQNGDVILVKGSQGKRMEKIVEEIMAEPQRKRELLVRQSKRWLAK